MGAFEILKQELELQKKAIEEKGGRVTVVNDYPSPSEITAGIYTTTGKDLSDATATEQDVLAGKTFYAVNDVLKVGTLEIVDQTQLIKDLFLSGQFISDEVYTLNFPEGITVTSKNVFRNNQRTAVVYFNQDLQKIGEYAFCEAINFSFPNFNSLQNLTEIGQYAFYRGENCGIDFNNLPNVNSLGNYCFYNCVKSGSLTIPGTVKTLGNYAFSKTKVTYMDQLTIGEGFSLTTLPSNFIGYLNFNCNFTIPASVTSLGSYCFYNTSFNNVTIPATVKSIEYSAFGAISSESPASFNLQSITFESSKVPTIASNAFATQHITNGMKIYVPDDALEAYKTSTNLVKYADSIFPISQKP